MKTPIMVSILFALGLPVLAQSNPETIQTKTPAKDIKKLTPEEREKLRGITPEARQAKLKERDDYIEKRRAELEKKKVAGKLTVQEAKMLQELEARKTRAEKVKVTEPGGQVSKSGPKR